MNKPEISVVIPTLNDPLLHQTVASLKNAGGSFEIIVVDDAGEPRNWPDVDLVLKNEHRLGPALSRQKGADAAKADWLMFSDGHMSYNSKWFDAAKEVLWTENEADVFCSVYLADKILDSFWHDTHAIGGADFYWWRHTKHAFSFADISPRRSPQGVVPKGLVPCVLGACYFVNRQWFQKIGGFKFMFGYGSEEIWLSLASWVSGGSVHCLRGLRVIHCTAAAADANTPRAKQILPELEVNRLAVLRRIMPATEYSQFLSWLPISTTIKNSIWPPNKPLDGDFDRINFMSKLFGLQKFSEALELMQKWHEQSAHRHCDVCGRESAVIHALTARSGIAIWACPDCTTAMTQNCAHWQIL